MASRRARTISLAPAPAASAIPWQDLPEAVVAAILQHVPPRQRFSDCVLVCRAWAAAAATVPVVIDCSLTSSGHCKQLQDWLRQHGAAVLELSTGCAKRSGSEYHVVAAAHPWQKWRPLHLPVSMLRQLRRLDLSVVRLQMAVQGVSTRSISRRMGSSAAHHSSSRGGDALLPQLQSLKLYECHVTLQLLSQLLSSASLSKLEWQDVEVFNDSWKKPGGVSTFWQRLQLLPKLSSLKLFDRRSELAAADLSPVSNMQPLQTMSLYLSCGMQLADVLAVLPAGLTHLMVNTLMASRNLAADLQARVCAARLCSLRSLSAHHVRLAPSTLSSLPSGLQTLDLAHVSYVAASAEQGARELLAALQHLTQLEDLALADCQLHTVQETGGLCCFAALTASSKLKSLFLCTSEEAGPPIPQAAFEHMFPVGKLLPKLLSLSLICLVSGPGHCVEAAQVASIAASCPALFILSLKGVTPAGFDCSCLLQLPLRVKQVKGLDWTRPAA